MAKKRKIGIHFGTDALDLVETEKQHITAHYCVPYLTPQDRSEVIEMADEIKLAAVLQKNLRDKMIETNEIIVSIPSKDVLLRSFLIPYLPKSEIKMAIDFEARKYVPIKLDVLYFDYLLQKVKEGKAKRFKTYFLGIKKEILNKFAYALEQSGLKILSIETSPFSLQRLIIYKKMIKANSNIAIIETTQNEGSICIIEKGYPQLIRDFKFTTISKDIYAKEPESLSFLLNKEVRLSFDYYRRQSPKADVDKIFLFTDEEDAQLKDNLNKEFNVAIVSIHAGEILGLKEDTKIGILKAYGAAIRGFASSATAIDLYQKRTVVEAKEKAEIEIPEVPISIKSVIHTVIIAGVFIFLFYLFVDFAQISALKIKLNKLVQNRLSLKYKIGSLDLIGLEGLRSSYNETIQVLNEAKKLKESNYITPILDILPSLLTNGVWLTKIDFKSDTELNLRIEGRAYLEDESEQMNSVNKFFTNLRENKEFRELFNAIDFDFIRKTTIGGFAVIEFGITCK